MCLQSCDDVATVPEIRAGAAFERHLHGGKSTGYVVHIFHEDRVHLGQFVFGAR